MFRVFFILLLTLFTCQATAVSYEREFKQIETRYNRMVPHIIKLSDQFGISAELITTTIYKESTFRPQAKHRKSSAAGLMQLMPSTARSMITKYGKELGVKHGANLYDPVVSMKLGVAYLHDVRTVVEGRIKRKASDAEIYLAYKYSPERAVKMIRHRGNHRMVDFYPAAAAGNPKDYFHNGRALTITQTKAKIASGFRTAKKYYGPKIAKDVAVYRAKEAATKAMAIERHIFREVLRTYERMRTETPPAWLAMGTSLKGVPQRVITDATIRPYEELNGLTSGRTYKGIPI
jgi:Transglycosylase SLT domain